MPGRTKPCPEGCGGTCRNESERCLICNRRARAEAAEVARTCGDCGVIGAKRWPASARCRKCEARRRSLPARKICPDCGGPKPNPDAQRCWVCYTRAFEKEQIKSPGVLDGFSAAAFRDLLERSDIDWPVKLLAENAGIGVPTIRRWLAGRQRPRVVEWQRVAAVLALEPCAHCHGSGMVDPSAAEIESLTAAVTRSAIRFPTATPPIIGAGWVLDRDALRLTIGATDIRVTRKEADLVAILATSGGAWLNVTYLSSALGNRTPHAAEIAIWRLRQKVVAAGADFGVVVDHVYAGGYRALLEVAS